MQQLTEPEALADFLRLGSASASGSIDIEPMKRDERMQIQSLACASCYFVLFMAISSSSSKLTAQQPINAVGVQRDANSKDRQTVKIELLLRARAECPSNLLLLSDLVSAKGSDVLVQQMVDVPLALAPRIGNSQVWTRSDIEKSLSLRGIPSDVLRWGGAMECSVRRIEGSRIEKDSVKSPGEIISKKASLAVKLAGYQEPLGKKDTPTMNDVSRSKEAIDKSQFTTPFTTPATINQAERTVVAVIENYLQTKTASAGGWNINVQIPSEHAKTLTQRRQILGIAGGQPPWNGKQDFNLLIKEPAGEQSITISATIRLPEMVVAANRPLSKGYVLKEEDLVWIPMPRGLTYGSEDCFSQTETLVGKQLRRAMSTQQVIRLNEVGPPMIIHVGDLVAIGVVSGGVTVETNGRAIEAGAIDDLIQIEIQPHRKRVLARITGDRNAEVIANGASIAPTLRSKSNSTKLR